MQIYSEYSGAGNIANNLWKNTHSEPW